MVGLCTPPNFYTWHGERRRCGERGPAAKSRASFILRRLKLVAWVSVAAATVIQKPVTRVRITFRPQATLGAWRTSQFLERAMPAGAGKARASQGRVGVLQLPEKPAQQPTIPKRTPENAPVTSGMDLGMTPKVKPLVEKVRAMVRDEIM